MSAARVSIGYDNFGVMVHAEARDDYLVLKTNDGNQIVLFPETYAALVQYVEQARATA